MNAIHSISRAAVCCVFVAITLMGCAPFTGKLGQHEAVAVLMSCDSLQNGGHIPSHEAGQTCEVRAAEQYHEYVNDLKTVQKVQE